MPRRKRSRQKTHQPKLEATPELQLVCMAGTDVGQKYRLEGAMLLGRVESCDICLDDAEVSRKHARLKLDSISCSIEDLDSRNGVFVNDKRTQKTDIKVGDRIRLGTQELLVTRHSPFPGQVVERQRFEALGRLAAGVAHDFNNMLAVITASRSVLGQILNETPHADPGAMECTEEIGVAAERARLLAARMLHFARSNEERRHAVDMSSICSELAALLRSCIPRSIDIATEVEPGLYVIGNAAELHQLMMNLMLNARDAMPDGGTLTVAAERVTEESPARLRLAISDSGSGIAPDVLPQIFEPFFSTKGEHGFGLGLATVRETAVGHGGSVEVTSTPGSGTTFTVILPLTKETNAAQTTITRPPPPWNKPARIMLVDDEHLLRKSMRRQLARQGHEVLEATDGHDALRAFAASAESFDLVILDYDMPRLNGAQTFHLLRDMDPMASVLLCSGHVEVKEEQSLRAAGLRGVLKKPYTHADLSEAVTRALTPMHALSTGKQFETLDADDLRAAVDGVRDKPTRETAAVVAPGPDETPPLRDTVRPDSTV